MVACNVCGVHDRADCEKKYKTIFRQEKIFKCR